MDNRVLDETIVENIVNAASLEDPAPLITALEAKIGRNLDDLYRMTHNEIDQESGKRRTCCAVSSESSRSD